MSLATLTLDIVGRSDKLRAELVKTAKFTKGWTKQTRASVNTAGKAFAGMGVVTAGAFTAIYANAADAADEIAKMSDRLGVGAKQLQALHHAGELTGVSNQVVNKSLQNMTRMVSEAADGTGEAVGALEKLNLSAVELKQLSPDQQFAAIADAIKNVKNQSERVELASDLFGARGAGLLNTLALGSDGLNAMAKEVDELGIALSRVELAKIEAANDAFFKAKETTSAFGKVLTAEVAPIVKAISDAFVDAAKEAGGFGVVSRRVISTTLSGIGYISDALWGLKLIFKGLVQFSQEFTSVFASIIGKWANFNINMQEKFGMDSSSMREIKSFADDWNKTTKTMREDYLDMVRDGPPSESIKKFVEKAQKAADDAAQAVAAKSKENIGKVYSGDLDAVDASKEESPEVAKTKQENAQIISLHKERFKRIYQENLQAKGNLTGLENMRRAEEQVEFQAEIERLRERGLLTQQVQAEINAMEVMQQQTHNERLREIDRQTAQAKMQNNMMAMQGASQMFGSMAQMTEAFGKKQSGTYKALFAISKAFSIAEAVMKIQVGLANASSQPYPLNIAAMANVAAATGSIVSTIQSTQYAGAFDKGGVIPAGQFGLVGEIGPELIQGPVKVTGRKSTEDIIQGAASGSAQSSGQSVVTTNNIKIEFIVNESNDEDFMAKIMQNRGQITNVIHSALGQTGGSLR